MGTTVLISYLCKGRGGLEVVRYWNETAGISTLVPVQPEIPNLTLRRLLYYKIQRHFKNFEYPARSSNTAQLEFVGFKEIQCRIFLGIFLKNIPLASPDSGTGAQPQEYMGISYCTYANLRSHQVCTQIFLCKLEQLILSAYSVVCLGVNLSEARTVNNLHIYSMHKIYKEITIL